MFSFIHSRSTRLVFTLLVASFTQSLTAQETAQVAPEVVDSEAVEPTQTALEKMLQRYTFQHAKAADALEILKQLNDGDLFGWQVALDVRTNSLLYIADDEDAREMEELFAMLDSETPASMEASEDNSDSLPAIRPNARTLRFSPGTRLVGSIETLTQQCNDCERQAHQLADTLRNATVPDESQRNELKLAVRKSFDARQQLQRAELAEFARRLQNIQRSIEMREKISQQIVDRRVAELLDPNLKWDAVASGKPTARGANTPTADDSNASASPNITRRYSVGSFVTDRFFLGKGSVEVKENYDQYENEIELSLQELAKTVTATCSQPPKFVQILSSSRSLLIGHTEAGHREIAAFMSDIGINNDRVRLQVIQIEITPEEAKTLGIDVTQQALSPEQVEELREISRSHQVERNGLDDALSFIPINATIPSGATKPMHAMYSGTPIPMTIAARIVRGTREIQIRLDEYGLGDEGYSLPRFQTLGEGQSVFFAVAEDLYLLVAADVVRDASADNAQNATAIPRSPGTPAAEVIEVNSMSNDSTQTLSVRLLGDRKLAIADPSAKDRSPQPFTGDGFSLKLPLNRLGVEKGYHIVNDKFESMRAVVRLECGESMPEEFWQRLDDQSIDISIAYSDFVSVRSGNLADRVVYLPLASSGGNEIHTKSSSGVGRSFDLVEDIRKYHGQPVVSLRLDPPTAADLVAHSHGKIGPAFSSGVPSSGDPGDTEKYDSAEDVLNRFQDSRMASDRVKKAFEYALTSARKNNQPCNLLHLLAGVMKDGSAPAIHEVAEQQKVSEKHLLRECEDLARTSAPTSGEDWKNVKAVAETTSQQWKHNYIGTEHLLMALIADGTSANQFLSEQGIEPAAVRDMVLRIYLSPGGQAPSVRKLSR